MDRKAIPDVARGVDKPVIAWALYDWANSAFSVTVIAAFFPLLLKRYWSEGADAAVSTFELGVANALGSVAIALVSPMLGAMADRGGARKRYLVAFAAVAIATTAAMAFLGHGQAVPAIALYVAASIGFAASNQFYDALLVDVAHRSRYHYVSGLGFGLGYLGGGVLFAANVAMTLWPQRFGLTDATQAARASLITVAVWWALFSIPLVVLVRERAQRLGPAGSTALSLGIRDLLAALRWLRRHRPVALFLLAYWLYIDGVGTVARMAIDYGLALGFDERALIVALLVTQFVGFPATIAFGRLGERIGARAGIGVGIVAYVVATFWSYAMTSTWEFYALAIVIGLVQGGVQSLSRSLYARMIPHANAGEFFGFYNMLGKLAAIVGPLAMGLTAIATGSSRASVLAVAVLFVAGGLLLMLVDERQADGAADIGAR